MSSTLAPIAETPRRALTARQADVVERLTAAAAEEIRTSGYDGLTVRNVARRAGVAPATAYTYFASKDHLVSETFWRRLRTLPEVRIDRRRSPAARVRAALKEITDLLGAEPELAAASTVALLAGDPDVKHLRDRVGAEMRRRLKTALGDDHGRTILDALDLALGGAMLQAGMGHLPYADLPGRLATVAALLLRTNP